MFKFHHKTSGRKVKKSLNNLEPKLYPNNYCKLTELSKKKEQFFSLPTNFKYLLIFRALLIKQKFPYQQISQNLIFFFLFELFKECSLGSHLAVELQKRIRKANLTQ